MGLGLNIVGKERLPMQGPAILAANHNSHLDTLVLMSMYPILKIPDIRPVAAADYFLRNRLTSWLSLNVIGIIPLDRSGKTKQELLFANCHKALDNNQILLIFPEGSRGKPEKMSRLKKGIHYLIKDRKDTPVIPVVMHGLGKSLPKGEALFVPFNCDVIIGKHMQRSETSILFLERLSQEYENLFEYCITKHSSMEGEE